MKISEIVQILIILMNCHWICVQSNNNMEFSSESNFMYGDDDEDASNITNFDAEEMSKFNYFKYTKRSLDNDKGFRYFNIGVLMASHLGELRIFLYA